MRLAEVTRAPILYHQSAPVEFPHVRLADGDDHEMGNVHMAFLHTPGHTPDGISIVVTDRTRGPEPWFVLTGDTLFVGAVGRPDLPGEKDRNAATLHASIHDKLLSLSGELEIHPAHFSGSACGAGLSGKPSSTLAFEKRWNPVLSMVREAFVAHVTRGVPAP